MIYSRDGKTRIFLEPDKKSAFTFKRRKARPHEVAIGVVRRGNWNPDDFLPPVIEFDLEHLLETSTIVYH